MEPHLKIIVILFVFLPSFKTVLPQSTPRYTVDKAWLRGRQAVESKTDAMEDESGMESSDQSGLGGSLGDTSITGEEDGDPDNLEQDANAPSSLTTAVLPVFLNYTTVEPKLPEATLFQSTKVTGATKSQVNFTAELEESQNSTIGPPDTVSPSIRQNSTPSPNYFNDSTWSQNDTDAPETDVTQEPFPGADMDKSGANDTNVPVNTTEEPEIQNSPTTTLTTTEEPEIQNSSTTTRTTTDFPALSSTDIGPSQSAAANLSGRDSSFGGNSERGMASDVKRISRNQTWGAILGTGLALAFVGLVIYVILRKKNRRDFSHRKLIEEFSTDPVLRLDNNEPLDLNYGGSAFYNPALEMDNIQMNNISEGHNN